MKSILNTPLLLLVGQITCEALQITSQGPFSGGGHKWTYPPWTRSQGHPRTLGNGSQGYQFAMVDIRPASVSPTIS